MWSAGYTSKPPANSNVKKILIIILLLLVSPRAFGDATVSEDAVKAAFIFHFINFTEWNDGLPQYTVCIPDDAGLRREALEIFSGKVVNGRGILVTEGADSCHILVSEDAPFINSTLTIGQLNKGALFEFRIVGNKMKFAIDLDRIKQSKLKISSQLLKLAIVQHGSS